MRFWDTSALVALLADEPVTPSVERVFTQDQVVLVWWATSVECASAIARRERERHLSSAAAASALDRLRELESRWHEVQPAQQVCELAVRLLRVHPLKAADALQLAAAFVGAERRPPTLQVVCLDHRLANAARREGFVVVEPALPRRAREPRRRYAASPARTGR